MTTNEPKGARIVTEYRWTRDGEGDWKQLRRLMWEHPTCLVEATFDCDWYVPPQTATLHGAPCAIPGKAIERVAGDGPAPSLVSCVLIINKESA